MPPKKVPAQLAHLVKWLPDLTAEAWVAVVQDARTVANAGARVPSDETAELLDACGVDSADQVKVVEQTAFLAKQASKGGKDAAAIHKRVGILGFTLEQVEVLSSTISEGVPPAAKTEKPTSEPATTMEPEPRPQPAAEPETAAHPAPEPAPAPKKKKPQAAPAPAPQVDVADSLITDVGVDVFDPFEFLDRDDADAVEHAHQWLKARLTKMKVPQLKVILRTVAQHMVGQNLDDKSLDALETVITSSDLKLSHSPYLLKLVSEVIAAESPASVYTLGQGHAKLVAACAKWYHLKKPKVETQAQAAPMAVKKPSATSDAVATSPRKPAAPTSEPEPEPEPEPTGGCSGWLEFDEGKPEWARKWFVLKKDALDVFPTEEDATDNIRGPEYTRVPLALCSLPKKDQLPTVAKKAGRTQAFVIRLKDLTKVLGAPLPKRLVCDPGDKETRAAWIKGLHEALQGADADQGPQMDEIAADDAAAEDDGFAANPIVKADSDDETEEISLQMTERREVGMISWQKDFRGKFVSYVFYVKNDADEKCEFTVRYSKVERKHNIMKKEDVFLAFSSDDIPVLPPKNQLKDMIHNEANVEQRGEALRAYFSHIFSSELVRTHACWEHVFNPEVEVQEEEEEDDEAEEREDWLTKGCMQGYVMVEVVYGPLHKTWIKKWLMLRNKSLSIMKDRDSSNYETRAPISALSITSEPSKLREAAPHAFQVDLIPEQAHLVKGAEFSRLVVDPEDARTKKRWLLSLLDNLLEDAEHEGVLKVEAGQSKVKSNRAYEDRYFRINATSSCLEMYFSAHAAEQATIVATMQLNDDMTIREPKKKRAGYEHAFRIDVDVPETADSDDEHERDHKDSAKWSTQKELENELLGGGKSERLMRKLLTAGASAEVPKSPKPKGRSNLQTLSMAEQAAATADSGEDLANGTGGIWSASRKAGAHKLILAAPDQASKDTWMLKLRRGIEASVLAKYVREVRYEDLADPYIVDRLYSGADTAAEIDRQMEDLLKSLHKDPDNPILLKSLTELSMVKAENVGGKRDSEEGYQFTEDEVENTVITAEGCEIYVKFEKEGSLGIVFEGVDGSDIHITQIAPDSQASKAATLVQGLQLTHVQRNDIRHCKDIDEVLTLVVNSARPLLLKFVRLASVTCKFQDLEATGIKFLEDVQTVDENGWSILRVDKLVEDTEAWDQVQLRPGLLVDTVTTYDGEDYSCRDTSTTELIEKIDSPQRPLKITFRDPEFDTAEAKEMAEQSKNAQKTSDSKRTKTTGSDATLSEGLVLASAEEFNATIDDEDGDPIPVKVRTSAAGVSIFGATDLLAYYPVSCILGSKDGAGVISLQVQPRQIKREGEASAPQMPYLDTSEDGGGVGLDDYQRQLSSAFPWLHIRQFETTDAMSRMKSAVDRHTQTAIAKESDPLVSRRCYDPAPIAYWAANPGSRVDVLKQGRVEYNVGTAKKPKWVKRMLSLNEAWACCHEITAVSAADLNDGVGEMEPHESVMVKDVMDCQLVEQKGKTWGLCFHMTTKDPSGHPRARYYATSSKDDSVCWINFIRALAGLKVVLEGVSTD